MEIEGEGEAKDREKIAAPKIKKIYNASAHELMPEELGRLIPAWTVALNSKLTRVIYGPISTITDVVVGRSEILCQINHTNYSNYAHL